MLHREWKLTGLALLLTLLLLIPMVSQAYPGVDLNKTFLFSEMNVPLRIPDAYKLNKIVVIRDEQGNVIPEPQDIFITEEGTIYVLDKSGGRVLYYNRDFVLINIISSFRLLDGTITKLNKPEGLFLTKDGILYIADTMNQRILMADGEGRVLRIISKPETFQGTSIESFLPTAVVADTAGRLSVIARNINMGLLQFDAQGRFTGYTGAPKVKTNIITKLWKRFSTQAQKAQMEQFVPTEYSSISIDSKDFIYGTISSISMENAINESRSRNNSGDYAPIRKLNSIGVDVLKRKGQNSPMGNLDLSAPNSVSRIIDVALGPSGSYTLLDSNGSILYTYSDMGVLLHAFGGQGKSKRHFERPVAVSYQGENLIVLDSILSQMMVFRPTRYGLAVLDAISAEYQGNFETAYQKWESIVDMNSSFRYAYIGLGKLEYEAENYTDAMHYFRYASEQREYSRAKEKNRMDYMSRAFPYLFAVIGGVAAFLLVRIPLRRIRLYLRRRLPK